jgi:hypothetical protein
MRYNIAVRANYFCSVKNFIVRPLHIILNSCNMSLYFTRISDTIIVVIISALILLIFSATYIE